MNLLTFRNFINFLLGFGWSAVLLTNIPWGWRMVISVAIGCGLVALVMYLFKWLSHMQQSGNINVYRSAAGCTGTTYLTIPAPAQARERSRSPSAAPSASTEPSRTGTPCRPARASAWSRLSTPTPSLSKKSTP